MAWWLWVILGFALLGCEMATPGGFFFAFFGVGAIIVGLLTLLGMAGPDWFQWLLFSVISVASLVPLRGRLVRWVRSGDDAASGVDTLVGQTAVLLDDLQPGEVGKAELRGTSWTARNAGEQPLGKGQRGRVTRVEGLTLWLRAE